MYEYKILTERDSLFAGRFDPDALQTALNSYAAEGWRVVDGFLATSLWKSMKAEIVVILEREHGDDGDSGGSEQQGRAAGSRPSPPIRHERATSAGLTTGAGRTEPRRDPNKYAISLSNLEHSVQVPIEDQVSVQAEAPPDPPISPEELNRQRLLGVTGAG